MATPTNLYQYYTGRGQSLPSVDQNAKAFQGYGLGSANSFTGTAAQNTALLGKLMGGSGGGYSSTPSSQPTQSSAPTAGGYSSGTPNGDPLLSSDTANLNNLQNQYGQMTAQQQNDLNTFAGKQQGIINNAYQTAAGQTNVQKDANTMNKIQDALTASQNSQAAVTPQEVTASKGSFANNDQVNTQIGTNSIPYNQQVAQLSDNLVPAENAYQTAMTATQNIEGNIVSGAQLAMQGFTAGQQIALKSIESKIAQGQSLTNDEYNTYTSLKSAQIGAAAQIQSANIGAGAQTQAAQIAANASTANTASTNANALKLAAYAYPGIGIKLDANGNYQGSSYLNNTSQDSTTPNGTDLNTLKNTIAQQIVKNPNSMYGGTKGDNAAIAQIMSQSGLSQSAAANLYYSVRKPYETLYSNPNTNSSSTSSYLNPVIL